MNRIIDGILMLNVHKLIVSILSSCQYATGVLEHQ